jgi:hypothetical protein
MCPRSCKWEIEPAAPPCGLRYRETDGMAPCFDVGGPVSYLALIALGSESIVDGPAFSAIGRAAESAGPGDHTEQNTDDRRFERRLVLEKQ